MVIQGGFYATSYLLVGIVGTLFFLFLNRKIAVSKIGIGMFIVAISYLVSMCYNGISYNVLGKSLSPFIVLLFFCIARTLDENEINKLRNGIEVLSLLSALAGILCFAGLLPIFGGMNAGRLQFTFQYANVAGIWFAISYVFLRDSQNKFRKYASFISLIALGMTQSIGAILVLFITQIFWFWRMLRTKWAKCILFLGLSGCVVVFSNRINQAIGTFIERIIQIYDGLRVLFHNPLGIGPGNWQYVYPYYQSAQYKAGVIHNSYVQVGVDSGIIAMLLMIILLIGMLIKFWKERDTIYEVILIILLHSVFDYSLSFAFISVLLGVFLGIQSKHENYMEFKALDRIKRSVCCVTFVCMLGFAFYGNQQLKNMKTFLNNQQTSVALELYDRMNPELKKGYLEHELYTKALSQADNRRGVIEFTKNNRYYSSEMMGLRVKALYSQNELKSEEILMAMRCQPYNKSLLEQMMIYMQNDNVSIEEKECFAKEIERINNSLKKKPAKWLKNQEELNYDEEN